MDVYNIESIAATIGGGFFTGALIGFALKKVLKILAILVGLFFAGLAYLQYQQIVNINWNKLQVTSQNAVTTLTNATNQISNQIGNVTHSNDHATAALAISNFGIPLTGSIAMGFAVGFMKGQLDVIDIHTIFLQEEDEGQCEGIMEGYFDKRYRLYICKGR